MSQRSPEEAALKKLNDGQIGYPEAAAAYHTLSVTTARLWAMTAPQRPGERSVCSCPEGAKCATPGAHKAPTGVNDKTAVQCAVHLKQTGAVAVVVKHQDAYRHRALLETRTLRLHRDVAGEIVLFFKDPTVEVEATADAAENKLDALRERGKTVTTNVDALLERAKNELSELALAGKFIELGPAAFNAQNTFDRYRANEVRHRSELLATERDFATAKELQSLLGRGIAFRVLDNDLQPITNTDAIPVPPGTGPVPSSVGVWVTGSERGLAPLPFGLLKHVVPALIPDVAAWIDAKFEPLESGEPANHGIQASDLCDMFRKAHGLREVDVPENTFGKLLTDAGVPKGRSNAGQHYQIRIKRTAAEKEQALRRKFLDTKKAVEEAEFRAWREAELVAANAAGPDAAAKGGAA
jgi:hypothetical protein